MTSSPEGRDGQSALTTGRIVIGLFRDEAKAEAAIRDLQRAGFTPDQIGMAMAESGRRTVRRLDSGEATGQAADEVTEGATVGALTGGILGGLMGLLGSLLLPGVGPVLLGGMMATLWGAGLGVAAGGFVGALVSLGVPENDAAHFDAGLRAGGVLVTVTASTGASEALRIMHQHEADLGPSGGERRIGRERAYAGPERRLTGS